MIGWAGQGSSHGLRSGSGISGMSIAIPLTSWKIRSIEFRDCSLSVNSITWALTTEFSDSSSRYCWVIKLTCMAICSFSFLSRAAWLVKSPRCCCFLIRDLLADSLFESILFRFLSSITSRGSPSDPEDWPTGDGDILFQRSSLIKLGLVEAKMEEIWCLF